MVRRAFTMVDALVVVAVIAVLIAILLPSLGRVRETGKTAVCLSNIRQIGMASLSYALDNSYLMMPAAYRTSSSPAVTLETYATILVNTRYIKIAASGQDPAVAEVTLKPSQSPFICPSGVYDRPSANFYPPSRTDLEVQRAWRCKSMQSGITVDTFYGVNGATWYWQGLPVRRIPNDADTSDFSQGTYYQVMRGADGVVLVFDGLFMNVAQTNVPNRISARHAFNTRTNIAFCDGHAQTYPTDSLPNDFSTIGGNRIKSVANRDAFNQQHPDPRWVFGSSN